MKILALDSSSNVATVAILEDNKMLAMYSLNHKKTHSQNLMPMIEEILTACETDINEISLFAVSTGPGSFTGLRIGLASAKALAHATNKPIIGASTLEAMAYNLSFSGNFIIPIMDARRNQVYTAIYKFVDGSLNTFLEPTALAIEELCNIVKNNGEKAVFLGDGVPVHHEYIFDELADIALFAPPNCDMQNAASVAVLAKHYYENNQVKSYNDITPEYLRKSQAEREYDEKNGGK